MYTKNFYSKKIHCCTYGLGRSARGCLPFGLKRKCLHSDSENKPVGYGVETKFWWHGSRWDFVFETIISEILKNFFHQPFHCDFLCNYFSQLFQIFHISLLKKLEWITVFVNNNRAQLLLTRRVKIHKKWQVSPLLFKNYSLLSAESVTLIFISPFQSRNRD